jgi:hypothetical protein
MDSPPLTTAGHRARVVADGGGITSGRSLAAGAG